MSIQGLHRFFSIPRLESLGLRGQRVGASDRRILALREMQAFRRFIFHGSAECVALDVVRQQRAKKDGYACSGYDQKKDGNCRKMDQQSSSHDGEVTRLNR